MEVKPGYKQTEVGVIPEEWDVRSFGELFAFRNGVNADKGAYGRGVRFVNVLEPITYSHIYGPEIPGRVSLSDVVIASYSVKRGDVLFNRTSETESELGLASTYLGTEAVVFGGFVIRGRPTGDSFDPIYSGYALRAPTIRSQIIPMGQGAVRANIGQQNLALVLAPVPPRPEQRAIAEALSDVDGLLGGMDRLITKKRDLKQAAMQQLLTGQTRLHGFRGEWPVKTLGELFNFSGGYSASRDQLSAVGHCYLHYGDIHTSSKTFVDVQEEYQDIPKLDISLKNVSSASLLEDGDVVFVDASEDDEGTSKHVVVVNKKNIPFISGLHTIVAKSKTDELAHAYRRYCFQTPAVRQQFLFYAVGTKVSGISKTNIAKLKLPVPTISEQNAIAEVLTEMDLELAALEQRREKTRDLKQAMMQELLTGKTRLVSSAENVISLPQSQQPAASKPSHNWQINEAVIIGVLAAQFGTEKWPLPRKRRVKLTYLLHRHVEGKAEGYLKKAAGPYNPKTKYQGPEAIALKNRYVLAHNNGTYEGLIAGENIAQAENYFAEWYPGGKQWLERFRFEKTDELELIATVDMAMEDLRHANRPVDLQNVKEVISSHPEWEAKLNRAIFSDVNIDRAIGTCSKLFSCANM